VGHVAFQGHGWIRPVYFALLLSHTVLAIVIVPLILITLRRAWLERFDKHRLIARWTFRCGSTSASPASSSISCSTVVLLLADFNVDTSRTNQTWRSSVFVDKADSGGGVHLGEDRREVPCGNSAPCQTANSEPITSRGE